MYTALITASCLSAVSLVSLPVSKAYGANCGVQGNYFDGYDRTPQSSGEIWEGVSANVTVQYGGLCSGVVGANNFNTAWVMLASADSRKYAQVGFIRYNGQDSAQHFSEWNNGDGQFHRVKKIDVPAGHKNRYWVQYRPSPGDLSLNVDTTRFDTSPNPFGNYQVPFRPIYSAETTYRESSVPGIPSAKVSFSPIQTQRFDNDQFQNFNTGLLAAVENGSPTHWKQALPNTTTIQLWNQ